MKKNKNKVIGFLLLAFVIILSLPVANRLAGKKPFNSYALERSINYVFYRFFSISLNPSSVIVGKDDFLFLGNGYGEPIHKAQGLYNYDKKTVALWANKLKSIQHWYESQGIQFVIVIAPNKHTVYNEKMPHWSQRTSNKKTITEDIVESLQTNSINMLDLRKPLIEKKQHYKNSLYLKTDTHWNGLGASLAYQEIIGYLNGKYQMNYKQPEYTYRLVDDGGKDLARFLKIRSLLPNNYETSIWFNFKTTYNICLGDINKSSFDLMPCEIKENPRYLINKHPQYTINRNALNKASALILSDSFGEHHSQLYNATFTNVWAFHYSEITGSELSTFVAKHKPDIVIYQLVERGLFNQEIVTALPEAKN